MRPIFLMLLLSTACSLGPRAVNHPLAQGPAGLSIGFAVRDRVMAGELLAVTDSGLWLVVHDAPTWAPYAALDSAWFPGLGGDAGIGKHTAPASELRHRLELTSRFPQGMSPSLLAAVLHAYGRDAVRILP